MSQKTTDPADTFRNLITDFERSFDGLANQFMGTGEFSSAMNQLQSMQLKMQKAFSETMAAHLATFNLPSRDDVQRLGENVHSMEQRIAHIEELLVKQSPEKSDFSPKGPPRTRQPPGVKGKQPGE